MANKKKPRLKRKGIITFSVTTQVIEDFREIINIKQLNQSNVAEQLILNFIKQNQ